VTATNKEKNEEEEELMLSVFYFIPSLFGLPLISGPLNP
jgi:hypothetical protein